jgi:hypothetical protein
MNQVKVVADTVKRLGVAQEQISMRQKIAVEILDDAAFRSQIEVNQHIATENNVQAPHKRRLGTVRQIDPAKVREAARRG